MKKLSFFLCALMLIFGIAGIASATPINNDFGLTAPATTISFDELGIANGTEITDDYLSLGVSFDPRFFQTSGWDFLHNIDSPGTLQNFNPPLSPNSNFSIVFNDDQTGAAFAMSSYAQDAIFTAYLDDVVQESFTVTIAGPSWASDPLLGANFYGFKDFVFDEIGVQVATGVILDNLQFNPAPVPEPATMLLLGTGLVGLAGFGRKKLFRKK